jgi:hypothetical protein
MTLVHDKFIETTFEIHRNHRVAKSELLKHLDSHGINSTFMASYVTDLSIAEEAARNYSFTEEFSKGAECSAMSNSYFLEVFDLNIRTLSESLKCKLSRINNPLIAHEVMGIQILLGKFSTLRKVTLSEIAK